MVERISNSTCYYVLAYVHTGTVLLQFQLTYCNEERRHFIMISL